MHGNDYTGKLIQILYKTTKHVLAFCTHLWINRSCFKHVNKSVQMKTCWALRFILDLRNGAKKKSTSRAYHAVYFEKRNLKYCDWIILYCIIQYLLILHRGSYSCWQIPPRIRSLSIYLYDRPDECCHHREKKSNLVQLCFKPEASMSAVGNLTLSKPLCAHFSSILRCSMSCVFVCI